MNTLPKLTIPIGNTPEEQTAQLQAIKDAMTAAMILCWEAGSATADSNTFAQASMIYQEADTHLHFLSTGHF